MRNFLTGIILLNLLACSADPLPQDFKHFELSYNPSDPAQEEIDVPLGYFVLEPDKAGKEIYSYMQNDGGGISCEIFFSPTKKQINDLKNLIGETLISFEAGDNSGDRTAVELTIDDKVYFQKGNCHKDSCLVVSQENFCEIQTFIKELLQASGQNLSECPQDIFNILLEC